jgi:menaquinone-9 beta-reductase
MGGNGVERTTAHRFGFRCHYLVAPWSDFVEVYWTDRGQLYVTPVSGQSVCVALITREWGVDAFDVFPETRRNLAGTSPITRQQGAVSTTQS